MWPHEKLKILVPRTPPDPPLPPLTPPRGPGGPKMAKMHSLKSIDDNLCQKSHFWGVKKIDLFFHSECTRCVLASSSSPLYSIRRLQGWALLQNTSCVAFSQKTGKLSVGNTPTFHHHHHRGCAGKKIENCKFLANPEQF